MPTGNYEIQGKKLPSVTQILGRFKLATPLIIWANRLGLDGKDYFQELKNAGNIGTELHDLAEKHIKQEQYDLPEDDRVINCFTQFLDWWHEQDYKVVWTEKTFVSKEYKYGGCPDLLVNNNILIDFKTSKGIYADYLLQGSAYAQLIKENDGIQIEQFIIVQFPKEDDVTGIKKFNKEHLDLAFNQFKNYRESYELDKQINKIMKEK